MILDLKKYKIDNIPLEKKEVKFLLLLSDNEWHTRDECMNYLKIYTNATFFKRVNAINKKTCKNFIINKYGIGYKIKNKIKINYWKG